MNAEHIKVVSKSLILKEEQRHSKELRILFYHRKQLLSMCGRPSQRPSFLAKIILN